MNYLCSESQQFQLVITEGMRGKEREKESDSQRGRETQKEKKMQKQVRREVERGEEV